MKRMALAALITVISVSPVMAESIKGGNVACASKKALNQFTKYAVNNDQEGMEGMMGTSCIYTDMLSKFEAKTVDWGVVVSKVRVSLDEGPMMLYVPSEAAPK